MDICDFSVCIISRTLRIKDSVKLYVTVAFAHRLELFYERKHAVSSSLREQITISRKCFLSAPLDICMMPT